jgi:transmembrane sensor
MASEFSQAIDQAILWHVRMQAADARAEDWAAFTDWLESDPANSEAYDRIALADADLGGLAPTAPEAPAVAHVMPAARRGWHLWRLAPFAAAAALLLAILSWSQASGPALRFFVTKPGETRTVALGGGTRIELNGDTRVAVDMATARFARLERGEATFVVRHDAAQPFVLEADGHRVVDAGTVFNVALSGAELSVGVAQGSVLFDPQAVRIALPAGHTLRLDKRRSSIELGRQPPVTIGSWREGRLVYSNSPVGRVAVDVARAIGKPVTVDGSLQSQRFTGVIIIDDNEPAVMHRVAALLDAQARRRGEGWSLSP